MDADTIMALDWVETNTPPQATLAVLPTGLMINYLSRRTNPSRYPNWPPPEIAAFGQEKMTDDFIRNSPDYIIVIGTDLGGFGEKYFGMETRFGGDLMKWVNAHYEQKCLIGSDWVQTGRFGIKILQKTRRQEALPGGAGQGRGFDLNMLDTSTTFMDTKSMLSFGERRRAFCNC